MLNYIISETYNYIEDLYSSLKSTYKIKGGKNIEKKNYWFFKFSYVNDSTIFGVW